MGLHRLLFQLHLWIGLVLGVLFALVSLSGSLLMLGPVTGLDTGKPAIRVSPAGPPLSLEGLITRARRAASVPSGVAAEVTLPEGPERPATGAFRRLEFALSQCAAEPGDRARGRTLPAAHASGAGGAQRPAQSSVRGARGPHRGRLAGRPDAGPRAFRPLSVVAQERPLAPGFHCQRQGAGPAAVPRTARCGGHLVAAAVPDDHADGRGHGVSSKRARHPGVCQRLTQHA